VVWDSRGTPNNPLKTGVSQESKPPMSHLQQKLYSNKNSNFFCFFLITGQDL